MLTISSTQATTNVSIANKLDFIRDRADREQNTGLPLNGIKATELRSTDALSMERLREAAEGFEQIFIKMMLGSMRKTLDKKNDILHGGFSQDVFEDMLYDEFSKDMASEQVLGLADIIIDQYKQHV